MKKKVKLIDYIITSIIWVGVIVVGVLCFNKANKIVQDNIRMQIEIAEYRVTEEWYDDILDELEDRFEMEVDYIIEYYELKIEYLKANQFVAENDRYAYDDFIDMFGSLNHLLDFLVEYEQYVRDNGYISLQNYYENYWND